MEKQKIIITSMFLRYITILLLGLGNLYLFYKLLTPLTVSVLAGLVSLFTNPIVIENSIYLKRFTVEIIRACVAGSAFYLLSILIFSTGEIKPEKRIKILLGSFALLFSANMIRLLFLVSIINASYFETIHWFLWNFVSVIFVVGIWLLIVYTYKIKQIPIYSDFKYLTSLIKSGKEAKRSKKHKKSG